MELGIWETVIMSIIVLHFVAGFGYLMYKLAPRKKEKGEVGNEN